MVLRTKVPSWEWMFQGTNSLGNDIFQHSEQTMRCIFCAGCGQEADSVHVHIYFQVTLLPPRQTATSWEIRTDILNANNTVSATRTTKRRECPYVFLFLSRQRIHQTLCWILFRCRFVFFYAKPSHTAAVWLLHTLATRRPYTCCELTCKD